MNEKERLKHLIDNPKKPSVIEWVYEVEALLEEIDERNEEAWTLIDKIKFHGGITHHCDNLVALLRQIYKKRFENIIVPTIKKPNQVFVAMWFTDTTKEYYERAYKPVLTDLGYEVMRIDEKRFSGSIINEIVSEITDSKAMIADLTGNRGGVYYEAGIARGLQLCNHPIKLVLTCKKDYFVKEGVHFDVSGDNIILYEGTDDLKERIKSHMKSILS